MRCNIAGCNNPVLYACKLERTTTNATYFELAPFCSNFEHIPNVIYLLKVFIEQVGPDTLTYKKGDFTATLTKEGTHQ